MTGRSAHFAVAALLAVLAGCEATTSLTTSQPGATVEVKKGTSSAAPRSETLTTTSFGNYEFRVQAPGREPLTGVLPLRFNGGYLAADILFFAPAMFFNLREVFPYYEFDLEQGVVRYKDKNDTEWRTYTPIHAEAVRAQTYFEGQAPAAGSRD